jgi:predicted dienelactone hydrolase
MRYDPFARGPYPVGVVTARSVDATRGDRRIPVELWFPATERYHGLDRADPTRDAWTVAGTRLVQDAVRDAEPRSGSFPLVLFSHGSWGHRRQSTFLCTHLASHGYVVAAPDHPGNTTADLVALTRRTASEPLSAAHVRAWIADRPVDLQFVLDGVVDGRIAGWGAGVDAGRVGAAGHSFGGWTVLALTARDPRIRATVALAPAGGADPLPGIVPVRADLDWERDVPTLYLAAQSDTLTPLRGIRGMFERTRATKQLVVLENADHFHFCDRVEEAHELFRRIALPGDEWARRLPPASALCPGEHAYLFVRALALAHLDATLEGRPEAVHFLGDDVETACAARGVRVESVRDP